MNNNSENLVNITNIVRGNQVEYGGAEFIVSACVPHNDKEMFVAGTLVGSKAGSLSLILSNDNWVNVIA